MSLFLNRNMLPTSSKKWFDETKNENNNQSRYDYRMFIPTQMILKDIQKIELFNSDSTLCSSVINLDEITKKVSTKTYVWKMFQPADIIDDTNGSILWFDNNPKLPYFKYNIVFSAPLQKKEISFKNFEKNRLFYFRFTTIDGTVVFSDKFLFPYGLAMGNNTNYTKSRLYLNKKVKK